jgi:hypothetical protein
VVSQFSETARKFQTLNDSYTDLHEQLARSSQVLCGDLTGPLLQAPAGHQDLIPADVRAGVADGSAAPAGDGGAADVRGGAPDPYADIPAEAGTNAATGATADDAVDAPIQVSEPAQGAAPADVADARDEEPAEPRRAAP